MKRRPAHERLHLSSSRRRYRWLGQTCLTFVAALSLLALASHNAAGFGSFTDEAVTVWQHRDSSTSPTGWDIWYSALGQATAGGSGPYSWHAAGGPAPEAAPIATLAGDDKNPHVATNAGVTIAVWQHAPGTDSAPGDWDIYFSQLNGSTGLWTTPFPVATLSGDDYDPNIAVDSNGSATAVWVHRNPDGTRDMYYSVQGGGTWSAPAALPVGASGGQASLPEVTVTSVASAGGALAHKAVAAWSDVPATAFGNHRMLYSIFDGLSWNAPAEIESAATGIAVSIGDVGFANYVGTDPDPFGTFGRLGVTADASGNAYVVWGGGPVLLGLGSPGVVGAILNISANTWLAMCTFGISPCPFARFIGVDECENPDDALTTGGGDFVGVFNFAGFIEHTFRTGGNFTGETFSYDSVLNDQRPSDAAVSATAMIAVNWGAPVGPGSEIIWSIGTITPGVSVSFSAAANLVPAGLAGEDMFPEIASGFTSEIITGGLTLTPATATNPVGTSHTVTATVTANGVPQAGVTVTFTVSGANTASGSCVTDASGQCPFTYTGTNAGSDTITATATVAGTVLTATATKIWEGAQPAQGRMTGGGSVISKLTDIPPGVRVTHGFELHCDASQGPNNLQINWGKNNKFHLDLLTSATCSLDTSIGGPNPPAAGFNKYTGAGTGRFNGVSGATITWEFTDAGEPGKNDHAHFHVSVGPTTVLSADGFLNNGNHQAHAQ